MGFLPPNREVEAGVAHRPRAVLPPLQSWETRSLHPTANSGAHPPVDPQAPTGPQDSTRKARLQETVAATKRPLRGRPARGAAPSCRAGGAYRPAAALGGHPASFTPRGAGTPLGARPCGALRGGCSHRTPELGRSESQSPGQGGPVGGRHPELRWHHAPPVAKSPHHTHSSPLCRS